MTKCCRRCGVSQAHYQQWLIACAKADAPEPSVASLRRRIERLEAELEWYADPDNHEPVVGIWTDGDRTTHGIRYPVLADGGERARKALGK